MLAWPELHSFSLKLAHNGLTVVTGADYDSGLNMKARFILFRRAGVYSGLGWRGWNQLSKIFPVGLCHHYAFAARIRQIDKTALTLNETM